MFFSEMPFEKRVSVSYPCVIAQIIDVVFFRVQNPSIFLMSMELYQSALDLFLISSFSFSFS